MKKVFIAAALAAMIVSCGSKGNKSAEMIAESESDSLFAVNDSTLGDLQTYTYEGVLRLSGNLWLVSFKISYLCLPLFYETRTTPSCHPSGCAYRQL